MYTLFTNNYENYYLVSKNSLDYHDFDSTKTKVMEGSKKEIIAWLEENSIENIVLTLN